MSFVWSLDAHTVTSRKYAYAQEIFSHGLLVCPNLLMSFWSSYMLHRLYAHDFDLAALISYIHFSCLVYDLTASRGSGGHSVSRWQDSILTAGAVLRDVGQ